MIASGYNNVDVIELAVPIKSDAQVMGVLITGYNLADFQEILHVEMFGEKGKATVIDSEGVVIASNETEKAYNMFYTMQEQINIDPHSFELFQSDVANGSSGILNYDKNDNEKMIYYQSLGINDWPLLLNVPAEQISVKTNLILTGMAYIGTAIAALELFLMLFIVLVQRNPQKKLEYLLYVDPTTDGISFAKFEIEAQKIIEDKKSDYAVLQLNVKKCKLINTTYGLGAGKRLLKHI